MAKKRTTRSAPSPRSTAPGKVKSADRLPDTGAPSSHSPATLFRVAQHAGVSRSTVSNVANGLSERVSPRTFQRVAESIRLFNYRPNPVARLLRSGHTRTQTVGLLVPSISTPLYACLARALDEATRKRDFTLLLGNTNGDPATEQSLLDEFIADGVRCVVLASSTAEEPHLSAWIDRGLCIVSFDRLASADVGLRMDTVSIDNFQAAQAATRHLIEKGHTAIAYATQPIATRPLTSLTRRDRHDGYLAAMKEAGQKDNVVVLELPSARKHPETALTVPARQIALTLLGRRNRPTAIVAMNDMVAFALMAGLHELGVHVPDDISVVGIDGLPFDALASPPLTSMHQPLDAIAEAILQRTQARLANPRLPPTQDLLPAELVARASVKDRSVAGAARIFPELTAPSKTPPHEGEA